MMDAGETGKRGEKLAADFLISKGYDILATNYSIRQGEVDIIARAADTIVFVEVKTRSSSGAILPRDAVGAKKRHRLRLAAKSYLQQTGQAESFCRFDVIEIYNDVKKIKHIENAFE